MAKIVIVHGISNQYVGENELHAAWYPALCDGLARANCSVVPRPDDCFCSFYGDLFRLPGHLGFGASAQPEDVERATVEESALLEAIWVSAAETEPEVTSPNEFQETLVWAPRIAERALVSLAKSKYLATYLPLQFFGDLKQLVFYLNNRELHAEILRRVMAHIQPETSVVIGHSLGSVIAYEAVCAKPEQVRTLITVGSPLGIRNVVFDKLTPRPPAAGLGHWPGAVKWWTNLAARGDIVAPQKDLRPLFGDEVKNTIIDSGWDAHSSTRYLNTREAGEAIARNL